MKQIFVSLGLCGVMAAAALSPALAQTQPTQTAEVTPKNFIKKRYTIHGTWDVSAADGQTLINFKDDFKTKGGPDLKVYLSPKHIESLDGQTAFDGALKIGVLKSNKGAQTYVVPEGVDLTAYKSVIIQCEAFSVLWGGFNL